MSGFDRLGGESTLRAILSDFYQRVFDDVMIGYMFIGQDRARLIDREYEYTAHFLGADIEYRGRTMGQAHRKHHIGRGHFERRFKILEETLDSHNVPQDVRALWLQHTRDLAAAVMGPASKRDDCDPDDAESSKHMAGVIVHR